MPAESTLSRRSRPHRLCGPAVAAAVLALWVFEGVGARSVEPHSDASPTALAVLAALGLLPGSALLAACAGPLHHWTGGVLRRRRAAILAVALPVAAAPFAVAASARATTPGGDPPEWLVVVGTAALAGALATARPGRAQRAGAALAALLVAVALTRELAA
jgi:hypothetical protein